MITDSQLLSAGYKTFKSSIRSQATQGFQKRFDDDNGLKYYVTIWEYSNSEYKDQYAKGTLPDFSYAPDVQFERKGVVFNVEVLLSQFNELEEVEAFVEELWVKMGCDYYERGV